MQTHVATEIHALLKNLSSAWLERRYEEIAPFFRDDVVFALPGFSESIRGGTAITGSYVEFMNRSKILEYSEEVLNVDSWGQTAVATTRWHMIWESEGIRYNEKGNDAYCLIHDRERWCIAWRAIVPQAG
jgi:hypothetical protein